MHHSKIWIEPVSEPPQATSTEPHTRCQQRAVLQLNQSINPALGPSLPLPGRRSAKIG
jgi:hypothetical protein